VLYCHLWPVLAQPRFSPLSHKRNNFRGGGELEVLNMKYVVLVSQQLLFEIFPILRRVQQDVIINVHRSSC